MHQTKKGNQWHFGMKAHIGVDADSGLVHTVIGTPANVNDITQAACIAARARKEVFADCRLPGRSQARRKSDANPHVNWHVAMRPGQRRGYGQEPNHRRRSSSRLEKIKASIRAKVEHPFRVIKRQFGHRKVRYRGLTKNTSQLLTLFALSNLWMVRKRIVQGLQA